MVRPITPKAKKTYQFVFVNVGSVDRGVPCDAPLFVSRETLDAQMFKNKTFTKNNEKQETRNY